MVYISISREQNGTEGEAKIDLVAYCRLSVTFSIADCVCESQRLCFVCVCVYVHVCYQLRSRAPLCPTKQII